MREQREKYSFNTRAGFSQECVDAHFFENREGKQAMREEWRRTELLLGAAAMERLAASRIAIFGIGGVGGHAAEALVRSGVGAFDLFDDDRVALSNINRQIVATHATIGQYKTDVMRARMLEINPSVQVAAHHCFFMPETADSIDFTQFDYIIDAIDTVTAKIELVLRAQAAGVPIISAMGAGNKLDPTRFEIADIYKTSVCPLARVMRQELKKRRVKRLKVVYSKEEPRVPQPPQDMPEENANATPQRIGAARRSTPGSTAFTPSVAGLILASEVVRDLTAPHKVMFG